MLRAYPIDGQPVIVSWVHRQHLPIYIIRVAGVPAGGSVEKTALGRYLAVDAQGRPLGTFAGLREAVERVVREAPRGG
jgi:hypothetical protein